MVRPWPLREASSRAGRLPGSSARWAMAQSVCRRKGEPRLLMWRRGGLVLAGLEDDEIQAGEGDQLRRRGEGLDGIGLAEETDDAERAGSRARSGGRRATGSASVLDLALELLADGREGVDLGQERADADAGRRRFRGAYRRSSRRLGGPCRPGRRRTCRARSCGSARPVPRVARASTSCGVGAVFSSVRPVLQKGVAKSVSYSGQTGCKLRPEQLLDAGDA